MPLGTFVAGRYLGSKNANGLGMTREGFTKRLTSAQELVNMSDAFGESIIDGVYRGGNCTVDFIAKEYLQSVKTALWPWGARGVLSDDGIIPPTPIGRLASQLADAFLLSALTGTPAATSPASHTASAAILAANFDTQTLFDSRLREIPIRFQYLPFVVSGTVSIPAATAKVSWFSET